MHLKCSHRESDTYILQYVRRSAAHTIKSNTSKWRENPWQLYFRTFDRRNKKKARRHFQITGCETTSRYWKMAAGFPFYDQGKKSGHLKITAYIHFHSHRPWNRAAKGRLSHHFEGLALTVRNDSGKSRPRHVMTLKEHDMYQSSQYTLWEKRACPLNSDLTR